MLPAPFPVLRVSSAFEEAFSHAFAAAIFPDADVFRFPLDESPPGHRRYLLGPFEKKSKGEDKWGCGTM